VEPNDVREQSDVVAKVLTEALPYIQRFADQTLVVKYGGSTMASPELRQAFISDIVLMRCVGMRPVVVHGGGPEISEMMQRLGKEATFVDGLRVTDEETVNIVEMVLKGRVLQRIVAAINLAGGRAVGLSGKDGSLFISRKIRQPPDSGEGKEIDIGYVGEIVRVNPRILEVLDEKGFIPVISPLGLGDDGKTYNVNADTVAGAIAGALAANKLIILTDAPGILRDRRDPDSLIPSIPLNQLDGLRRDGIIEGGMIPKVQACEEAIRAGVAKAHIIDGRIAHSLLLEVLTDRGVGTEITQGG
jgi:acetylglutamate kinase